MEPNQLPASVVIIPPPSDSADFEQLYRDAVADNHVFRVQLRDGEVRAFDFRAGAVFGYLAAGAVLLRAHDRAAVRLLAGEFFCLTDDLELEHDELTIGATAIVFLIAQAGFRGFPLRAGGPIETRGRLKYIDRCSDTLLIPPVLKGAPCLNHLHFPPGINQTYHTHPSLRAGIVARGRGFCEQTIGNVPPADGVGVLTTPLEPGGLFLIAPGGWHRFLTTPDESMDVIAFHPDSDFGPEHENHPMVNRTWVDGRKIDNSGGEHVLAEIEPSIVVPPAEG
jgi:hypothetical protein